MWTHLLVMVTFREEREWGQVVSLLGHQMVHMHLLSMLMYFLIFNSDIYEFLM